MTREELIAYGEDYLKDLISAACEISEKHKEFVKIAIAALKAEPCEVTWVTNNKGEGVAFKDMPIEKVNKILAIMDDEPCEAVSRKAAIEAVMDLCKHYTPTKSVHHPHVDFVIEVLQDLPSVTPKQRMGEWTFKYGAYTCECGYRESNRTNYCPNCGAKMEGESE